MCIHVKYTRVPTDKPRKISMIFEDKNPKFPWQFWTLQNGKNTGSHVSHGLLTHLMTTIGCFKKICKVFLLDLINSISVNNVYAKYIFIYTCSYSKLCLFQDSMFFHEQLIQNSMIFPWFSHFYKFQEFFEKFNAVWDNVLKYVLQLFLDIVLIM